MAPICSRLDQAKPRSGHPRVIGTPGQSNSFPRQHSSTTLTMSASAGSQDRDESPSSDVSPLTMPDGSTSKTQYFSPLTSPRLDSIPEHHENLDAVKQHQDQALEVDKEKAETSEETAVRPNRPRSGSSISFREPTIIIGEPVGLKGQPKHRKNRIRTSSPAPPT